MTRPIRLDIDLSAIRHNYLVSRAQTSAGRTYAVIKADAYGHGSLEVARALADVADGFALLNIEDAIRLRRAGIRHPMTMLEGAFDLEETVLMAEHGIAGAVHSPQQIDWLARLDSERPVEAWLKVNSGMNRLGFQPGEFDGALARLQALPSVRVSTVMTHFATADDERGVGQQWARFQPLAERSGLAVSAANSAATFRHPHTHGDAVRPGITLYGCSPFAEVEGEVLGLRPGMTLSADVIATQTLAAGETVGYGATFTASQAMRIGVVACGYADGYPRIVPSGTPVLVDGQASGTVGRVSMDMLVVDLTALPSAGVGSQVTLWGAGLPIERIAAAAGTIGYELMCAVAPRVPRHHHDARG
ncbi:alanine racemase [Crenobacter caeni]|uniref:Alanine racemase n=1 Tax=Crenobacter caeni TaxID=2705474 RepID=A0A6B2KPZ2_9NEIS|nr:alanine racemase [Crenobacter caeni]NDV12039.1 alanine racemase [Crenobacter caeni]